MDPLLRRQLAPRAARLMSTVALALALGCSPAEPREPDGAQALPAPRGASAAGATSGPALDFPAAPGAAPAGPVPPGCAALPAETGPQLALQLARLDALKALTFSPDGAFIASTGMMEQAQIWDGKTAQLRLVLGGAGTAKSLVFDPTSSWVAGVVGADVVAWQLETGRRRVLFAAPAAYEVTIAPDGRSLTTTHRGVLRTWTPDGKALATMPIGVERAAYSPDGTRLLSWERAVSADKTVTVWDPMTGVKIWSLTGSKATRGGEVAWSPDGDEVAWSPDERDIDLVDAKTGKTRRKIVGGREIVQVDYAMAGGDRRIVARDDGDRKGRLLLWDAASGRLLASHAVTNLGAFEVSGDGRRIGLQESFDAASVVDPSSSAPPFEIVRKTKEVWQVAMHPTDKRIAVTGHARTPVLFDTVDGRGTVAALETLDILEMSLSADGSTLATLQSDRAGWDREVRLWDARTGALRGALERRGGDKDGPPIYTHVTMSPGGDRIAVSLMGRVDLFDGSGRFERTAEAFPKYRTELPLTFSRDGRRLAIVGGPRDTVRIYDPRVGIVAEHEGRIGRIGALAFSPDQKRIAVGSTGKVAILDVASGAEVALLKGEFREVDAIVWRDDRTLFTGNQTGTIARATLGGAIEIFKAHRMRLNDLAISKDGKLLASAAEDRVLRVWNAETMQPIAETTFDERAAEGVAFHPTAPIVFSAGGPVRAMRFPDGAVVSLYATRTGGAVAGLAVSAGGLFGGDEKAFAAVRFAPGHARARAPLAWFDSAPASRRPALFDDLARGCPVARPGQGAP